MEKVEINTKKRKFNTEKREFPLEIGKLTRKKRNSLKKSGISHKKKKENEHQKEGIWP